MLDDDGRYAGCFCAAGRTVGSRDLDNPAPWGEDVAVQVQRVVGDR